MSVEHSSDDQTVEQSTSASEEQSSVSMDDFNQLKSELESLRNTNARLLNEKKEIKSKYQETVAEREQREREELKAKEDWKGMYSRIESEKKDLESKYKSARKDAFRKNVYFEVSKLASDAHDVDDVINNLSINDDNLDLDKLELNDVAHQIDELKKGKPWLFKQSTPSMNTSQPGYKEESEGEKFKSLDSKGKAKSIAGLFYGN